MPFSSFITIVPAPAALPRLNPPPFTTADAANAGLGALSDTDLSREAAQLRALQSRQALAALSLSPASQAPQTLLSLFK